jgi:2'-5' RNA ligase
MTSKRLFIAVEIENNAAILSVIKQFTESLTGLKIKWVEEDNLHLTLVFFGETEIEKIYAIKSAITNACKDIEPFQLAIKGAGVFKKYTIPSVIWLGIERCHELWSIKSGLDQELLKAGFIIEKRDFKPHLTLGRVKAVTRKDSLKNTLDNYSENLITEVTIKEVILFESILNQQGPVYKRIFSCLLKKPFL